MCFAWARVAFDEFVCQLHWDLSTFKPWIFLIFTQSITFKPWTFLMFIQSISHCDNRLLHAAGIRSHKQTNATINGRQSIPMPRKSFVAFDCIWAWVKMLVGHWWLMMWRADEENAGARLVLLLNPELVQKSSQPNAEITLYITEAGADVAVVYTPCYYKVFLCFYSYWSFDHLIVTLQAKMTSPALEKHFTEVADASPIPVVLYRWQDHPESEIPW